MKEAAILIALAALGFLVINQVGRRGRDDMNGQGGTIYDTESRTAFNPVTGVYTNMDSGAEIWRPGM